MVKDFRVLHKTSIKTHERTVSQPYSFKVNELKRISILLIGFFLILISLQIVWNLFDYTINRIIIQTNEEKSIISISDREKTEILYSAEGSFPIPMIK